MGDSLFAKPPANWEADQEKGSILEGHASYEGLKNGGRWQLGLI